MNKAEDYLALHSSEYRTWRDEKENTDREADLRVRGQALADAMSPKFDQAIERVAQLQP